jgi:hypothetical protein
VDLKKREETRVVNPGGIKLFSFFLEFCLIDKYFLGLKIFVTPLDTNILPPAVLYL